MHNIGTPLGWKASIASLIHRPSCTKINLWFFQTNPIEPKGIQVHVAVAGRLIQKHGVVLGRIASVFGNTHEEVFGNTHEERCLLNTSS